MYIKYIIINIMAKGDFQKGVIDSTLACCVCVST